MTLTAETEKEFLESEETAKNITDISLPTITEAEVITSLRDVELTGPYVSFPGEQSSTHTPPAV